MTPPRILCIGLTPALQQTYVMLSLLPGTVNRAVRRLESVGGKAVNTARVVRRLGDDPWQLGLLGGATGDAVEARLAAEGLSGSFTRTGAPTRVCTTIIDAEGRATTELVEEASTPTAGELAELAAVLAAQAVAAAAVVVAGRPPPGTPERLYADLIAPLSVRGLPVVIDTCGPAALAVAGPGVALLKMNRDEQRAMGPDDPGAFARSMLARGLPALLVTDGGGAVRLDTREGTRWFRPPPVVEVNAVGSGDAATAGLVHALVRGANVIEAVRFGLACGAANAEVEGTAEVDPARARELLAGVREEHR
jgi:1-phosphofructokinase family hexose kinase